MVVTNSKKEIVIDIGFSTISEGYVFTFNFKDTLYKFKVKGEKHVKSKVRAFKSIDSEKEQLKIDIAASVTPAWRLEQMFDLSNDIINNKEPDIKNIGDFIKRVNLDIIKEESDIITNAGLKPKDILGIVVKTIKVWYQEQLDNYV
jgi:hypothetical protein